MRDTIAAFFAVLFATAIYGVSTAQSDDCGREALTAIVAQASKALTIMNKDKTASFQLRLKELKAKRRWTDEQLLQEAAPIVKNPSVAAFDTKTKAIFGQITGLGSEQAQPTCAMRDKLNELLAALVKNNVEKWALIMDAVDAELSK